MKTSGAPKLIISSALSLEQVAIACTGKWRDLRYGSGSVSDLSIDQ